MVASCGDGRPCPRHEWTNGRVAYPACHALLVHAPAGPLRFVSFVGHALFFIVMIGVLVLWLFVGVAAVVDHDRPKYWGTFTETSVSCDPGPRGGCTSSGRWLSDDGTIVLDDVALDGVPEPHGTVRASYRPGGLLGDDENHIVHTAEWTNADLWMPWLGMALTGGATWRYYRKWYPKGLKHGLRAYQPRHAGEP